MSAATRVLFVTSNGTGLGHLTRSLAIAARLEAAIEPLFLTLSAGAPAVARMGHAVEYVASYDRPGAGNDLTWTLRTRERFRAAVREASPALVMFDGTHPYERLLPALRASGSRLVWCRRALWRDDADTAPLHRAHLFDAVLEPGELGEGGSLGPTAARRGEVRAVTPIVLLSREDLIPRADAERELGLEAGRRNVLVQLGQGPAVREANARALRHLASRDDVQVAALGSALERLDAVPTGVVRLRPTFPIARFFAAFDAAVSAAGYNQAHELAALGVPSLLVPMPRETDDQAARARAAERAGLAIAAAGPDDPEFEPRLDELLDPERQERLRAGLEALPQWQGAGEAARWLESLVKEGVDVGAGSGGDPQAQREGRPSASPPEAASPSGLSLSSASMPADRLRTRPRRPPLHSVRLSARRRWIFVSSLPRTLVRVTRQTLTRPKARVYVLALGLEESRYEAELERALAAIPEPPEEVLVVTDRLDFAPLLRAGAGFEHVPAAGSRQAALGGGDYAAFRARRLALIRARRPRPRRVIELS